MPALIDLKTNLKSLGYGNDRPDGGSSNQPYVISPIPDGEAPRTIAPDFLLRNGYLNAINSLDDVKRIGKWFIDLKSPSGLLFTAKQELLERQNVNINDGINRIYNPLGTVAQVGVLSTGYHLNKQGFNVFREGYYNGGRVGYFTLTNTSNTLDEDKLSLLFKSKISNNIGEFEALAGKNLYGITPSSDIVNLISYSGGPGSTLGIGKTNIRIQNPTVRKKDIYGDGEIDYEKEIFNNPHNTSVLKNQFFVSRKSPTYLYNPNFTYDKISSTPGISFSFFTSVKDTIGEEPLNSNLFGEGNINELLIRSNNNIADNLNIGKTENVGINGRFEYGINVTDGIDKYLVPKGSRPSNIPVPYKYGASTQYIGEDDGTLSDNDLLELRKGNQDDIAVKELQPSPTNADNNVYTFSYKQTLEQPSKGVGKSTNLVGLTDFRQTIKDNNKQAAIPSSSYNEFNRETTYNTSTTNYRGNYKNGNYVLDPNEFISIDQTGTGSRKEDIIDFNFNIQNLNGNNQLIDFRAYLETWSDGAKAEWSSIKYMGRAESFYKYNGFSRDVSTTFLVPALSRGDMISNYKKLNALIWSVSPSYSPTTNESTVAGLMRGSITKFTMGNYFNDMPCIIKGVDFLEIEGMGWDINRDGNGKIFEDTSPLYIGQLPKGIKVTVNLTPIHNFVPRYGEAFIGQDSKYIFQ